MPTRTKKSTTRPTGGRRSKSKKNDGLGGAMARVASRLRPAKSTRARKPSKARRDRIAAGAGMGTRPIKPARKGLVGIAAGAGLGGVAMAKRRRRADQHEATNRPLDEAPAPAIQDGGGEHGNPKGPGLADAA